MSKSTHQIAVKGVDQTAGAFNSIQKRAAAASGKLRGMLGGALAAAGSYLGLRAIKGGMDELGHLSDLALKTSTSIDELTATTEAFNVLGIQNMSMENLAKAFDYMQKTTGRSGLDGLLRTIEEIGKIEDAAERGQMAMKIFGRSGMEFMPLINAASNGTQALEDVIAAMPRVSQSAADAGDGVADAFDFMAKEAKSIWLQGLGHIAGWMNNEYPGGVRQGALAACNYMTYYAKLGADRTIAAYRKVSGFWKWFWNTTGAYLGAKFAGASWKEALDIAVDEYLASEREYVDLVDELDTRSEGRRERWKAEFDRRDIVIRKYDRQQTAAAVSTSSRQTAARKVLDAVSVNDNSKDIEKTVDIRNELILGGSNDSLRAAMMGPQLQSESKKQTEYLKKIADNTRNIDENTDGDGAGGETFKEI